MTYLINLTKLNENFIDTFIYYGMHRRLNVVHFHSLFLLVRCLTFKFIISLMFLIHIDISFIDDNTIITNIDRKYSVILKYIFFLLKTMHSSN